MIDQHGDHGAIDAIYADLVAVADAGLIELPDWLTRQEIKPQTPRTGIWYSLVYGEGTGVAGELDLKRPPRPR